LFDERWPEEAEEFAAALDAVLVKYCPPDALRTADDAGGSPESADSQRRLEQALDAFGLWELPNEPLILTRAAVSLGANLTPVPFVSAVPAQVVLREAGVANGIDRTAVPAGLSRLLVSVGGDGLGIVATPNDSRVSAAGEDVVVISTLPGQPERIDGDADAIRAWGFLLEAARLVGAAQALLRYGVSYVSQRNQFGVPVGSFQGVSHPLADAATSVQAADLLTRHAAYLADSDGAVPLFPAVMAAAKARAASRQAAAMVHQALGGYGFTVEADCQLYSRRIRAWTAAMPDPTPWLAKLARTLTDPATRDQVTDLWQFDRGFALPGWARESR
jgi:hypothetical protein